LISGKSYNNLNLVGLSSVFYNKVLKPGPRLDLNYYLVTLSYLRRVSSASDTRLSTGEEYVIVGNWENSVYYKYSGFNPSSLLVYNTLTKTYSKEDKRLVIK
jgi:hypothetical protein